MWKMLKENVLKKNPNKQIFIELGLYLELLVTACFGVSYDLKVGRFTENIYWSFFLVK